MPEGDVIWSTARRLHEALAGQVLTRSDFRVPKFATADLSEQLVTEVVARGKHLLIRTSGGLTVHTHLKMDGFWRVRPVRPGVRPAESFNLRLLPAHAPWGAAAPPRPRPAGRRGAARPAEPRGHRQRLPGRDAVPARPRPVAAGRLDRGPARP